MNSEPLWSVAEMGCAEQAELLTRTLAPLAREPAAAILSDRLPKKMQKNIEFELTER